jgi:hypothetical protein
MVARTVASYARAGVAFILKIKSDISCLTLTIMDMDSNKINLDSRKKMRIPARQTSRGKRSLVNPSPRRHQLSCVDAIRYPNYRPYRFKKDIRI